MQAEARFASVLEDFFLRISDTADTADTASYYTQRWRLFKYTLPWAVNDAAALFDCTEEERQSASKEADQAVEDGDELMVS